MYNIARNLLAYINTHDVANEPHWGSFYEDNMPQEAEEFLTRVYGREHDRDIWDPEFRENIDRVKAMDYCEMTKKDVYTYFTFIICIQRTCNMCFQEHAANGVLKGLLERYIEICDQENAAAQ